jgi:hypothetical protein
MLTHVGVRVEIDGRKLFNTINLLRIFFIDSPVNSETGSWPAFCNSLKLLVHCSLHILRL